MNFVEIELAAHGRFQIGGTNGCEILSSEILNAAGMSPARQYAGNLITSNQHFLSRSGGAFERSGQDGVEKTLADVIAVFHHVYDQMKIVYNEQVVLRDVLIEQIQESFFDGDRFIGSQLCQKFPHTDHDATELPVDVAEHGSFAIASTILQDSAVAALQSAQHTLRSYLLRRGERNRGRNMVHGQ